MTDTIVGRCASCETPNYGTRFCESCGARYIPPVIIPQAAFPAQLAPTNVMAILALIFGILGGTLLPIIFGHVALAQIARTGERGHGMAVAGAVLGYLSTVTVIIVLIVVFAAATSAPYYGGY
jgi:Domain of unknown function (DUF4190)